MKAYNNKLSYTSIFCVYLIFPPIEDIQEGIDNVPKINTKYTNIQTTNTSTYNVCKTQTFLNDLKENIKKIEGFKKLSSNWNNANANKFNLEFIDMISSQLSNIQIQPKIFPTGRNSLQFEYERKNGDYLEFEIFESHINFLSIKNNEEKEDETSFDNINKLVNEFYA
jgi:hypothetical protein